MNETKRTLYRGKAKQTAQRRELAVLEPTKLGNHRALHQRADGLLVEIVVPGRYEEETEES
jgi:hypothetical protein